MNFVEALKMILNIIKDYCRRESKSLFNDTKISTNFNIINNDVLRAADFQSTISQRTRILTPIL
jgi:hypothetical protein